MKTHANGYHLPACFKDTETKDPAVLNTLFDHRNEFWIEVASKTKHKNRPLDLVKEVMKTVPRGCAVPPELHAELQLYNSDYAEKNFPFTLHNTSLKPWLGSRGEWPYSL